MRIYDGSPRQDFEEVLRSIGAFLDQRGMREILLVEVAEGFLIQGLVASGGSTGSWSESYGTVTKETITFLDDDIVRFMDEGESNRGTPDAPDSGPYERALRVIGRYIDEHRPRDVFFFEQDGAYVVRLLQGAQQGSNHVLVEFTRDDLETMIAIAPSLRDKDRAVSS
jgi:hypothetical protein